MSAIKRHYFQQIERQASQERSLAAELWPDGQPALAIPIAHFDGSYPAEPTAPKVCKTRGYIVGQGQTAVKLVKAHFSQWRGYTHQKSGRFIQPCQHCRHERVLEACHHIERASFQYAGELPLRWQEVTQTEKRNLTAVIRKRKERGAVLSYVSFPLENGRFILLHDAPDIGGQQLPTNRRRLFSLVSDWALNTPKGKRAGKGLATWGKPEDKPEKQQGGKKQATEEATGKRWRLITEDYGKVWRELSAYEGRAIDPKNFSIPVQQIIDRLEAAGIAWAVESGELPGNVTLKGEEEKPISVKCDIGEGKGELTAVFSQNHLDLQPKQPPGPAPIYLNGEWIQ